MSDRPTLTLEEATAFFSAIYFGENHIPHPIRREGRSWKVRHFSARGDLSTYDFAALTRLVLLAHQRCIRVGLRAGKDAIEIIISARSRTETDIELGHPTIEEAIAQFEHIQRTGDPLSLEELRNGRKP